MEKTPALAFIPQRPPFVLVDNILACDETVVTTDFRIPEEHILVQDGRLSEAGLMENIAQTCAARIGWMNQDKPVRIGVIGSINNFEHQTLPQCGQTLVTTVTVESSVFEAIIVHADIQCEAKPVAQCDMKVFVVEN
jgi:predicted hotdog family 3-hydroxylacyl-ACP dehydratase